MNDHFSYIPVAKEDAGFNLHIIYIIWKLILIPQKLSQLISLPPLPFLSSTTNHPFPDARNLELKTCQNMHGWQISLFWESCRQCSTADLLQPQSCSYCGLEDTRYMHAMVHMTYLPCYQVPIEMKCIGTTLLC